jgi:hypothetical protein
MKLLITLFIILELLPIYQPMCIKFCKKKFNYSPKYDDEVINSNCWSKPAEGSEAVGAQT